LPAWLNLDGLSSPETRKMFREAHDALAALLPQLDDIGQLDKIAAKRYEEESSGTPDDMPYEGPVAQAVGYEQAHDLFDFAAVLLTIDSSVRCNADIFEKDMRDRYDLSPDHP
jgi:hypothetical protein